MHRCIILQVDKTAEQLEDERAAAEDREELPDFASMAAQQVKRNIRIDTASPLYKSIITCYFFYATRILYRSITRYLIYILYTQLVTQVTARLFFLT